jgi:hypothetical protein
VARHLDFGVVREDILCQKTKDEHPMIDIELKVVNDSNRLTLRWLMGRQEPL